MNKPTVSDFNYFEFVAEKPADNILQRLAQLADKYDALVEQSKRANASAKELQDQLQRLKTQDIPEAMEEAGMAKCTTANGRTITVKTKPVGNLPSPTTTSPELAEKRVRILRWIHESGFGKIMKRELRVSFDQAQEEQARQLADSLDDQGFATVDYSTIHPATYNKLIRECMEEGMDLPDFMEIHVVKEADVK